MCSRVDFSYKRVLNAVTFLLLPLLICVAAVTLCWSETESTAGMLKKQVYSPQN